jgi:hypothetical protein
MFGSLEIRDTSVTRVTNNDDVRCSYVLALNLHLCHLREIWSCEEGLSSTLALLLSCGQMLLSCDQLSLSVTPSSTIHRLLRQRQDGAKTVMEPEVAVEVREMGTEVGGALFGSSQHSHRALKQASACYKEADDLLLLSRTTRNGSSSKTSPRKCRMMQVRYA